ncbi:MAG: hypothetical protein KBT01_01980 [Clostridiales bacterium]|nr:hypothetical protein [Candidatus Blautia equi]
MDTLSILDDLQKAALKNEELRQQLLETRKEANPLSAFCRVCRERGYMLYEMDVLTAGEEFHAAMKRSTNGGGENSPKLEEQDDFYELFFASIGK